MNRTIIRAMIEDRAGKRVLLITEDNDAAGALDSRSRTLKLVRLTGGKAGKGTWDEIDTHLAALGLAAGPRGWRRMTYDMRTVCRIADRTRYDAITVPFSGPVYYGA